jgi:hypothetical protein
VVVIAREKLDAGAAILRDVHCDVRLPDQRLHVGALFRGEGDSDAGVDVEQNVGGGDRLGERGAHPFRDRQHALAGVGLAGENGELVAAEPGDRVALPHG